MQKLLGWLGCFAGGTIGWAVGARLGMTSALIFSFVGTGVGLYIGRRLADSYF